MAPLHKARHYPRAVVRGRPASPSFASAEQGIVKARAEQGADGIHLHVTVKPSPVNVHIHEYDGTEQALAHA